MAALLRLSSMRWMMELRSAGRGGDNLDDDDMSDDM
jgi:hypothetical protein